MMPTQRIGSGATFDRLDFNRMIKHIENKFNNRFKNNTKYIINSYSNNTSISAEKLNTENEWYNFM